MKHCWIFQRRICLMMICRKFDTVNGNKKQFIIKLKIRGVCENISLLHTLSIHIRNIMKRWILVQNATLFPFFFFPFLFFFRKNAIISKIYRSLLFYFLKILHTALMNNSCLYFLSRKSLLKKIG